MQVRPARPDDMAGVREVADGHDLLSAWPTRPDYLDHELAVGRLLVAVDSSGRISGFGGGFERDGVTHLGDLFVRPGLEGTGIGGALLAELLSPSGRRITFSSSDPRALALYARRGLVPVAPLLHLRGDGIRAPATEGFDRVPAAAAASRAMQIEAACRGYARPHEHEFLASLADTELVIGSGAFAYLRPLGDGTTVVGPAAGRAADIVLAAAAAGRGAVTIALPGPHPALRPLLEAGFRIADGDTIMTSPAGLIDWTRIVPDVDLG